MSEPAMNENNFYPYMIRRNDTTLYSRKAMETRRMTARHDVMEARGKYGHDFVNPQLLEGKSITYTQSGSTYPLDLVRSRLSIITATIGLPAVPQPSLQPSGQQPSLSSAYHTSSTPAPAKAREQLARQKPSMWGMTLKVIREEGGIRALYRGLPATAFGVAPYVGINFAAYEALRGVITPPGKTSVARKLTCGALAGA